METQEVHTVNKKPWYKKKRYIIPILGILTILGFSGDSDTKLKTETNSVPTVSFTEKIPENTLESDVFVPSSKASETSPAMEKKVESTPVKTNAKVEKEKSTPVASNCNPNYSGCLKIDASDYDCAGGSGNGPYYTGPVQVIGFDEYDLDRDSDGWGCEKN